VIRRKRPAVVIEAGGSYRVGDVVELNGEQRKITAVASVSPDLSIDEIIRLNDEVFARALTSHHR